MIQNKQSMQDQLSQSAQLSQSSQLSQSAQFSQLAAAIPTCASGRQQSFRNRLKRMRIRLKQKKNIAQGFAQLEKDIEHSQQQLLQRKQHVPVLTYPESLPISQQRQRIADAIKHSQVVIVAGETGSGKTTQIPKICLELGRGVHGMIGHTQPRRIAARSVATRIAEELNSPLGKDVGYKVRFSDHTQSNTYIKLMTDGILLAEIQRDPKLLNYDTIIIDEAHERSLNIDFLLGYLKNILPKRPDLKVIITSATINTQRFSDFFHQAPIIEVSGRSYPVDIEYRPISAVANRSDANNTDSFLDAVLQAVDEAAVYDALGDILIFLPGEREIRETTHALQQHTMRDTEILPLYSRLSPAEQDRVFKSHRGRRIVLATNVAETSLTVPGIRFVIDSGVARISRYSSQSKVQRLPVEAISQASANQRAGRCGRVAAGVCFRLYSEDEFRQRPEHTDPEIRRTHLASVILQMVNLGLGDIHDFNFMEPPEKRAISDGYRLLEELQAVDKGTLTAMGKKLVRLPVDPRLARMLIQADIEGSLHEVLIIVAALSVQDPRVRPIESQQQADEKHRVFGDKTSDFLSWLALWNWYHEQSRHLSKSKLKQACQQHYLAYMRMREWHDLHGQLLSVVREIGMAPNRQAAKPDDIHKAILAGLLGQIALKHPEKGFLGARNLKLAIFPGSPLAKKPPLWLMAASLLETSRLFARTVAPIDPAWLEALAGHLITRQYSEPHWSSKQAQVSVFEKVSLYGLPIVAKRRIHFGVIDPIISRQLFIRHALVMHEFHSHGQFFKHNKKLLHEIEQMEHKTRRKDFMTEEQARFDFFDAMIPATVFSGKLFEQWRKHIEQQQPKILFLSKEILLQDVSSAVDEARFPNVIQLGKLTLKLHYHFDPSHQADGITLRVPMMALGQLEAARFDWLVPGMLEEKLTLLIKGLAKALRKNFVPAPQFAKACAESMVFAEGALLLVFARELKRMTGVNVAIKDWNLEALPKHLCMNFMVLDEHGTCMAQDTNLQLLQHQFSEQLRDHLQQAGADSDISRTGITRWNFDVLPQSIQRQRGRAVMQLFPALVDHQDSVAIELFDHASIANQVMLAGCRRLLMLSLHAQVKLLKQSMPNQRELCLYYATIGKSEDLLDQIICSAFDAVFFGDAICSDDAIYSGDVRVYPRSQREFEHLLQTRKSKVVKQAEDIALDVLRSLKAYATLQQSISQVRAAALKPVVDDIQSQMGQLIYDGFVAQTPAQWLVHLPRFIQAADMRLGRAGPNLKQDQCNAKTVQSLWAAYQQEIHQRQQLQQPVASLCEYRWLLEELRNALFAQQIKTSVPVSVKRLSKLWQEIQTA